MRPANGADLSRTTRTSSTAYCPYRPLRPPQRVFPLTRLGDEEPVDLIRLISRPSPPQRNSARTSCYTKRSWKSWLLVVAVLDRPAGLRADGGVGSLIHASLADGSGLPARERGVNLSLRVTQSLVPTALVGRREGHGEWKSGRSWRRSTRLSGQLGSRSGMSDRFQQRVPLT